MSGRKFRLSVHRKNEERKKYACKSLPVSVKLTNEIMVFRVTIPLDKLKFIVSLPLDLFLSSPVVSLQALQARLQVRSLPSSWMIVSTPALDSLVMCKLRYHVEQSSADVIFTVTINSHLEWCVMLCGNYLDRSKNEFLSSLPPIISSLSDLTNLFISLDSSRICIGNNEEKLIEVVRHRNSTLKGEFIDSRNYCSWCLL